MYNKFNWKKTLLLNYRELNNFLVSENIYSFNKYAKPIWLCTNKNYILSHITYNNLNSINIYSADIYTNLCIKNISILNVLDFVINKDHIKIENINPSHMLEPLIKFIENNYRYI